MFIQEIYDIIYNSYFDALTYLELLFLVDRDIPYVFIVVTLYEIIVWFDWRRDFFCHHTLQVHTYFRLGYIEEKFMMFEIGIAASGVLHRHWYIWWLH